MTRARWTPLRVAAVLAGGWAAAAMPLAAQSPAEVRFERLHAELFRAAEAALLNQSAVPTSTAPAALPAAESETWARYVPTWHERLSDPDWRLLHGSFAAEGVPVELVAVGWVESRFQTQALSSQGARGVWQLMPATARRYGLVVSRQRDDRLDLPRSTRAAARHLADLYLQFGDWLLALAAYDAGADRVEAAMAHAGSRNFWHLRPWLPAETQNYVPAVLAAMGLVPPAISGGE